MDFTKFLSLIETESLHMAPITAFEDPFEGHPPRSVVEPFATVPNGLSEPDANKRRETAMRTLQFFQNSRKLVHVSCWHMNEYESAGMWSQYLRTGEGIAVQTTFQRLKDCLGPCSFLVSGATVQYVDFDTVKSEELNVMTWAALKRRGFEHERELRLLALGPPGTGGAKAKVDLSILIERVYVAPGTQEWVVDLLRSVLVRYGHTLIPVRSGLLEGPDYYGVIESTDGG